MKKLSILLCLALTLACITPFSIVMADEVKVNQNYVETFDNSTGLDITDLSTAGLTVAKASGYEYIDTNGHLVISKGDWSILTSIIYNPSYTWTNNRYDVEVTAKNDMIGTTQNMSVFLNFKDENNYYAVRINGASWVDDAWAYTANVQIEKCVDGVVEVLSFTENTGIRQEYTVNIKMIDNVISVYNNGNVVAYAKDNGEMVDGTYVAFGTGTAQGYFDKVAVSVIPEDKNFSEDFTNADLTDGTWVNADSVASINAAGNLVITDSNNIVYNNAWTVYGNDYVLSYKVDNTWRNTNYMYAYFNYQNNNNYYYVGYSGADWDSATNTFTQVRRLKVGKVIGGTTTEETIDLGYLNRTATIDIVSEGNSIKIYVNGVLRSEQEDEMNGVMGGYVALNSRSGGWFDDISLVLNPAKLYDGETKITSLEEMSGKTVAVKKNIAAIETSAETAVPIAAIKGADNTLQAVAIGTKVSLPLTSETSEISVNIAVPAEEAIGDLYLYLWTDTNELIPVCKAEKVISD